MSNAPSREYPFSVRNTDIPAETLEIYRRTLNGLEGTPYGVLDLFDKKNNFIFCQDYSESGNSWLPIAKLQGLEPVKLYMNGKDEDPPFRYIYIHAANSRNPLGCSKEQLDHVLSHHQVMPSFLEHVFTFHGWEDLHHQASFTSEASLESEQPRIEHCFNLVGVEFDKNQTEPFKHRQTVAYFSLDFVSRKSTWITLKANQVVRQGIEQSIAKLEEDQQPTTCSNQLSLALRTHLVIFWWSIRNWTSYIDYLQREHSELRDAAAYTPVSRLLTDPVLIKAIAGIDIPASKPQQSIQPQIIPMKTLSTDHMDMFTFGNLQKLYRQAIRVQQGLSVLTQNKAVLQDMLKYFEYLEEYDDFRKVIDISKDLRSFARKTQRCIRELDNQASRLSVVQTDLEKVISLFNGILQYHNQRIGESYAQLAKASTDKMEKLTLKTKHETVSIHVVTILTLFFLPATFIATFFGSGVIDFEKDESTGHLGYWSIRWGALKLFGLVCIPLTCFVLAAWALTYYKPWRKHREETLPTYMG